MVIVYFSRSTWPVRRIFFRRFAFAFLSIAGVPCPRRCCPFSHHAHLIPAL